MNFHEKMAEYAELAVRVGVNIQKGQYLSIGTTTETLEFTRLVVEKAYEAGAGYVHVQFTDEKINRAFYELAPEDQMSNIPSWIVAQRDYLVDQKGASLWIDAEDPDALTGVSVKRLSERSKAFGKALEKFRQATMTDKIAWSIVAIPSPKWAAKVFPNLPEEEQVPALWDAIFKAVRIGEGTAVEQWKAHVDALESRAAMLNEKRFAKLVYRAPGTDLSIELPKNHIWMSGASRTPDNTPFIANMPTEEVYTAPLKNGVNGVVRNTKPLAYQGNIIDGFELTFENGKIVKAHAAIGDDILQEMISNDEGSAYLGEIALVPHKSPISDSNILFFNTLFDENASNHLAIGEAYPTCIEGGRDMNEEQIKAAGLNVSITHEDFMIGSEHMDIDGIQEDGTEVAIFREGNWAF
ncbi:aminopeptidase [Paenisporosarcina cavernae]|uniref:Aminopeptidase n=1 Tax=Paenisporosarcina cavernae TaxID=2320858 RepID=A0A385YXU0_9BACL|nr:aminopeptidase [Paenisporosarcina cavernae]AYC30262.1 aminopeptidase [Paenisporosarcina cavernae]